MNPMNAEHLIRTFLCCLLYRLGGEQSFSAEEIDEIRKEFQGVQFFVSEEDRVVLRVRGPEVCQKAIDAGSNV